MDKKLRLIVALQEAALEIRNNSSYQWGHMGSCNCGFLVQKLTNLDKGKIHQMAMVREGDWREQLEEYCPNSGYPIDHLIFDLLQFGLTTQELAHLERLSDPRILNCIGTEGGKLNFNDSEHAALYMSTWANMLVDQYSNSVDLIKLGFLHNQSA
ncbi:hypothetical protein [Solitalea koreensis]|uniref:Uncharacterized protein n=1 Tax=Solitalea koreensis TaxID=543615 RepID=A0A521CSQ5_9SPHI|nr:hypothetical protein [Solitalea koreensis]SMO62415.1 hypothetical protein SAMN06265350_104328 [Solitalea koreensis]